MTSKRRIDTSVRRLAQEALRKRGVMPKTATIAATLSAMPWAGLEQASGICSNNLEEPSMFKRDEMGLGWTNFKQPWCPRDSAASDNRGLAGCTRKSRQGLTAVRLDSRLARETNRVDEYSSSDLEITKHHSSYTLEDGKLEQSLHLAIAIVLIRDLKIVSSLLQLS